MRFTSLLATFAAAAAAAAAPGAALAAAPDTPRSTLVARSTIPATLYLDGPTSGAALGTEPVNGVTPPFPGQPIPGYSAILPLPGGKLLGLADNGFGSKANSADYLLQLNVVDPNWKTGPTQRIAGNGSGKADVRRVIRLSDPWKKVPYPLTREDRQLTGADFDIESIQPGPRGSFYIGDEFGPYILHVDRKGRMLESPVPAPGVKSPQSYELAAGEEPTLPASGGFEAMAQSPDGRFLLPILEKALAADEDQRRRVIGLFDTRTGRYTGDTRRYRVDEDSLVADAQMVDWQRMLVLERDNGEGPTAKVKRVYLVDLAKTGEDGTLEKRLVVDLLDLRNSCGVTDGEEGFGLGEPFAFALQSVESLAITGPDELTLASDNNFPFSTGRVPGRPDDTEMIRVRLPLGGAPTCLPHRR